MISVELLAKHMAWANQEIFKEVKKLGPEVLDYYVVDEAVSYTHLTMPTSDLV